MVKLDIVRKSDAQLGDFFAKFTPVAPFVGATNGVGKKLDQTLCKVNYWITPSGLFR